MESDRSMPTGGEFSPPTNERVGQVFELRYYEEAIKQYLETIGQIDLLTREDEVRLSQQIEAGQEARAFKATWDQSCLEAGFEPIPVYPEDTAKQLETAIVVGEAARHEFIEANTRLVVSIAKRHRGRGLELDDLIQEGNIGLMTALEKFDYKLGWKFSTYASWWIRQTIGRAVIDTGRSIRIPVHVHDTIRQITKSIAELRGELQREPTLTEISQRNDIAIEKLTELIMVNQDTISIDWSIGDDGDVTLIDFVTPDTGDSNFGQPDEIVINDLEPNRVHTILDGAGITGRNREIINLRFGLHGGENHTLEEVGKRYNLTRERVRQIEQSAIHKVRKYMNVKIIKPDDTPDFPTNSGPRFAVDDDELQAIIDEAAAAARASTTPDRIKAQPTKPKKK